MYHKYSNVPTFPQDTSACFSAIFTKEDKFCDFLIASLDNTALRKSGHYKRKEFAPT